MESIANEIVKSRLIACIAGALQHSVSNQLGGEWLCMPSTTTSGPLQPTGHAQVLTMVIRLRGALSGELSLELARDGDNLLLSRLAGGSPDDCCARWLDLMKDTVNCLPKRAADAVTLAFSVESYRMGETAALGAPIGRLELLENGSRSATLNIVADDELLISLEAFHPGASPTPFRSDPATGKDPQLGRVIDVPLSVTLRFGQRTMRLREVLELNTGTLVELDRQVEEPVDLMLGERVIARGEVVIVDGNYGLRVTEIIERNPMLDGSVSPLNRKLAARP